jgi:hypothetical protein
MLRTRLIGTLLVGLLGGFMAVETGALRADTMTVSDNDDVADSLSASGGKAALIAFDSAPFPYHGTIPGDDGSSDDSASPDDAPFLDVKSGDRRGHTSARGGVYWEDQTYSDRRTLLYIPPGFDPHRPAAMVVFFHGNQATLARDVVDRQQVPRQLAQSGLNAVLVAPQFAVDALDSSAGGFWQDGAFLRYLKEAADRLAALERGGTSHKDFARMPVILVAQWIEDHQSSAFFFSAFGASSNDGNGALQDKLMNQGIEFTTDPPHCLKQGDVVFLDSGATPAHSDFVSHAWTDDPLTWIFDRVAGFPRTAGATAAMTCKR